MSDQTSPDTSPFNRGPQSGCQRYTRFTRKKHGQRRKRTFVSMPCGCGPMMVMTTKTCCLKLAVLPNSNSAVMIIIGAHSELCLTAATSLLLPFVPSDVPREVMTKKYANGLHHLYRPIGFYSACRTSVKLLLLLLCISSIFTSECICREYIYITKTHFQHVEFT